MLEAYAKGKTTVTRPEVSPKPGMRCSTCGEALLAGRDHPRHGRGVKNPRPANGPCVGSKGCPLSGVSPGCGTNKFMLQAGTNVEWVGTIGAGPLLAVKRKLAYALLASVVFRRS